MKTKALTKSQRVDMIIDYEQGELGSLNTLRLFSDLIRTKMAWSLQGAYGRTAKALIEDQWIDSKGKINYEKVEGNGITEDTI